MTDHASILHYLTAIGVTDDGHVSGGMTYLDWQEAYRSLTGAKTMRFHDAATGQGRDDKASKYIYLVRQLGLFNQKDVEAALYIFPVSRAEQTGIYMARHRFLKVFDKLGRLIREANELPAGDLS